MVFHCIFALWIFNTNTLHCIPCSMQISKVFKIFLVHRNWKMLLKEVNNYFYKFLDANDSRALSSEGKFTSHDFYREFFSMHRIVTLRLLHICWEVALHKIAQSLYKVTLKMGAYQWSYVFLAIYPAFSMFVF